MRVTTAAPHIPLVDGVLRALFFRAVVEPLKRILVFTVGEKWRGWTCQRCAWRQTAPVLASERDAVTREIQARFDEHRCADFPAGAASAHA